MRFFLILFFISIALTISSCDLTDKCPGKELCGTGCMTIGSSCCPDGAHYCEAPATCNAANLCQADGTNDPSGTYYVSASGCTNGYSTVSYRGSDYAVCNSYYILAVAAQCTKILDNCR